MRLSQIVSIMIALSFSSCGSSSSPTPVSGTQGGIVGNGLQTYSDSVDQLSFQYPSAWVVTPSPTKTNFSAENGNFWMNIQNWKQINHQSFPTTTDLANYLGQQFPGRSWRRVDAIARKGFGSEVQNTHGIDGTYYMIDTQGNPVGITFWLGSNSNQTAALRSIFTQLKIQSY